VFRLKIGRPPAGAGPYSTTPTPCRRTAQPRRYRSGRRNLRPPA